MKRRKIGNIPPHYPTGWFSILDSDSLKSGEVKEINVLGEVICCMCITRWLRILLSMSTQKTHFSLKNNRCLFNIITWIFVAQLPVKCAIFFNLVHI